MFIRLLHSRFLLYIIIGLMAAILISLIWFGVLVLNEDDATVDLQPKVLSEAKSVVGIGLYSSFADVDVPPNAAITKIYVSIEQTEPPIVWEEIVWGEISIRDKADNHPIFLHSFNKDPGNIVGTFETTFVQPLFAGSQGAKVFVHSNAATGLEEARCIEVTVVYCPNYNND